MKLARSNQGGFTIVELMIATTVLSVLLLLATVIMMSIGSLYKKGINQSNVQDAARTIMDSISQDIEMSNGTISRQANGFTKSICVNSTRYTYIEGVKIGDTYQSTSYQHGLWRDTSSTCSPVDLSQAAPSPDGVEMIPSNSRLTQLDVSGTAPFSINVGVAYGDDDLLCDDGTPGDCSSNLTSTVLQNPVGQILCKGRKSDQFCAAANLTTAVSPRLSQE